MSTFVLEENIGGRYESVRHFKSTIGAEVYTATDRLLGAKVLIKVVNSARYFRESNVLSLRRACNLVIPHDVYFFDSNHCVLVYPWFDGGDLRGRLRNLGPLSEEETTVLALDLLTALFELHSAGLTHGDLKPENVLVVSSEGHRSFHLSDFGSCAPVGEVLVKAWRAGSPAYEAPEAVVGKKTTKSDLYSLGIVLLEALRAEVPYKGMPKEIFRQARWELPSLSDVKSDSLRQLIVLLIQGDADSRLHNAEHGKSLLKNGIKRIRPIMPRQARRLPQGLVVRELGLKGSGCRMIASSIDGRCIAFVGPKVVSVYQQCGKHQASVPWSNAPPVWQETTLWISQGADIYKLSTEHSNAQFQCHLRYPPDVFSVCEKHLFWISKGLLGAVRMGGDHEPQFRAISSYVQRKVMAVTHTEVFTTTGVVGNQLVCYDHQLSQLWIVSFDGMISDVSVGFGNTVHVVVFQFGSRNQHRFYVVKDGRLVAEARLPSDAVNYGLMAHGCLVWRRGGGLLLFKNTGSSISSNSITGAVSAAV